MKKLGLMLLLIASTNAFAEWTKYSENNVVSFYIDFGTIKRKGNNVKMWHLYDFKTVQKAGDYSFWSTVNNYEYSCEERTIRELDFYVYSGNMRQGETLFSQTNIKKEPVSIMPDTVDDYFLKIACDKK